MIQRAGNPIFVVGSTRSATSAIGLGLIRGAGLPGFNEGHVFPLLYQLQETIDRYFSSISEDVLQSRLVLIGSISPQVLKDHIAEWFADFVEEKLGAGVWVDKTPDARMLQAVPLVARLYPEARFVFAKRRGIENIMSQLRKFPNRNFEQHCQLWSSAMRQWLLVREDIAGQRYIEIDQWEVALKPQRTAKKLGTFLQLEPAQIEGVARYWSMERPEQAQAAEDYRYRSLQETGWSEQEQAIFRKICLPLMEQYGYEAESRIFTEKQGDPVYLYYPIGGLLEGHVSARNLLPGGFRSHGRGFLIQPDHTAPQPAEVRYHGLEFFGHDFFWARLLLLDPDSAPVNFRLRIESSSGHEIICDMGTEVTATQPRNWEVELPPLKGSYDVVISNWIGTTEGQSNENSVVWLRPHFSIRNRSHNSNVKMDPEN